MGSKDQRHSRVDIFHQAYVGPLEAVPWTSFLGEQGRSLGALRRPPVKMATQSHTSGEMPLEELLALYGYNLSDPVLKKQKELNELAAPLPEMTVDNVQTGKDLLSREKDKNETHPSSDNLTLSITSHNSDLLHHLRGDDKDASVSSSEDDSESNSIPSSDGGKDIMVGSQYQAVIPLLCPLNNYNERAYEYEDQLLWSPDVLSNPSVEEFLLEVQRRGSDIEATHTLTTGEIVKDNEQALYELVKCNFDAEEALRRFRFNVKVFSEELCGWSEDECRNFEHGYRAHGKNFHLIQANKVRTRSVGECVEYYYMWKKSERHEYFTQQATKLSRKKCNMPTGNTEDAEPDGDIGEVEGATTSRSSVQLQPPSPPAVMELDKKDESLNCRAHFQGRPRRKRTPRFLLKP